MCKKTNKFITKASIVNDNFYDYSRVYYVSSRIKVEIFCPKHGIFTQTPSNHIQNHGCPTCGQKISNSKTSSTLDEFILKSNKAHSNKYIYNKTIYTNSHSKVLITCPEHGDFYQKAYVHSAGHGCSKCSEEKGIGWTYSKWRELGEKSPIFDSFKVYIIKCWNDDEEFYKIGKTFTTLNRRHAGKRLPYYFEVVKIIESKDAKYVSDTEKKLQKENKKHKYIPKIKFKGNQECFSKINLN